MAWNKPTEDGRARTPTAPQRSVSVRNVYGMIVSFIVILGVVIAAWWWLLPSEEVTSPSSIPHHSKTIKSVPPSKAAKYAEDEVREDPKPKLSMDPESVAARKRRADFLKRAQANPETMFLMTNRVGRVNSPNTGVEQLMDWIFNCTPGLMPPPPPNDIPGCEIENIVGIIMSKEVVEEGDSDERIARKEMVQLAKDELKDYLKNGGDVQKFFDYYYEVLNRAYARRQDAMELISNACREEEPEIARELYRKTNELLGKDNIQKIDISIEDRVRIGLTEDE